eukprot:362783-Chlamydomonas_euryale.AAC.11
MLQGTSSLRRQNWQTCRNQPLPREHVTSWLRPHRNNFAARTRMTSSVASCWHTERHNSQAGTSGSKQSSTLPSPDRNRPHQHVDGPNPKP